MILFFMSYLIWRNDGKPRTGESHRNMRNSKLRFKLGLSRLIDSNRIDSSSQPINRFKTPETIHYFYLFNGIVVRKCQQIDFYLT